MQLFVLFFVHVKEEGVCALFPVSSNCSSPFFLIQFKSWMQPSSVCQKPKMVNTVWSGGVKVVSREQHLLKLSFCGHKLTCLLACCFSLCILEQNLRKLNSFPFVYKY